MNKALGKKSECGASFAELTILLPFFLILMAGLFNFASHLWQMQVLAEAVRSSARSATFFAVQNRVTPATCSEVIAEANDRYEGYMTEYAVNNNNPGFANRWGAPEICFESQGWDTITRRYIRVTVATQDVDNCIFCFGGFFSFLPDVYTSRFIMPRTCSGIALSTCT